MSRASNRRARLAFEQLEDRCVPTVTATLSGGTLTVVGDDLANDIVVQRSGASVIVTNHGQVVPITVDSGWDMPVNVRPLRTPGPVAFPIDDSPFTSPSSVVVWGMGGNDRITSVGGVINPFLTPLRVALNGGDGDDTLAGGMGNESFSGGAGNDWILAGRGNNFIDAGAGDDKVVAGDGNDVVIGGDGNDMIDGGAGNDDLRGGLGNDSLTGGPGFDRLSGSLGADTFIIDANDITDVNAKEGDVTILVEVPVYQDEVPVFQDPILLPR